ncbi:MAG: SpoIID/LytB domain-containing protein [Deltaproteobacteria bacterium]|nr:SpoIID/LytB domain-containing protein [Deltaproteobacteria bacterium]
MQEVVPQKLHAPSREPMLRVGIVLAEDKKSELRFSVPLPYEAKAASSAVTLAPGSTYVVRVSGSALEVTSGADILLQAAAPLHIAPLKPQPLAPKSGMTVEGIVAGRGFHWKKELTQTLPGSFEVHLSEGNLVLVNEINFESYIACVISSEMGSACPAEFCKAQAVAARSWAFVFLSNKHSGTPFTICNDDDCQRYQGTTHATTETIKAVLACKGKLLLTKEKNICPAYYSKSCGGHTEDPAEIFGFHVTGLSSFADSNPKTPQKIYCSPSFVPEHDLKLYLGAVDEKGKYYRWTYLLTHDVLVENLKQKFGLSDVAEVLSLIPKKRSQGKRITQLQVGYRDQNGAKHEFLLPDQYDIRRALHPSFLFSSAFELKNHREKDGRIGTIDLHGAGWGHGVGLCQIGALGMALAGHSYIEILKHYFPACELVSAY